MAERTTGLLFALGLAAVLFFATRDADASAQPGGYVPPAGSDGENDSWWDWWDGAGDYDNVNTQTPVDGNTALAAFMATIRQFESNHVYNVIYGGQHFDSYADHPRIKVWFYDRTKPLQPGRTVNNYSTAAGAYQFISTTWDRMARRLGLTDFSPQSQDAAAALLLQDLGVTAALNNGDVARAFALASGTWASLPGSKAQQNPQTLAAAMDAFNTYAGVA